VSAERIHGALLYVLPRRRRRHDGAEMTRVFAELCEHERHHRGPMAVAVLWMRETAGLVRFGLRERWAGVVRALGRFGPRNSGRGPTWRTESRWAWRGIRARGLTAGLSVALLAAVLAANAIVFSVADSLVFHRLPYPEAERIVAIAHKASNPEHVERLEGARLLSAWAAQTDLVAAAGGYLPKGGVFVTRDGQQQRIRATDVTVGLFDVLGVRPKWGRSFSTSDLADTSQLPAILSARFARSLFGNPRAALGQRLEATGAPLVIVGVMSDEFAFPTWETDVWRGIDPTGPMTTNFGGVVPLLRMTASSTPEEAVKHITERAGEVGRVSGLSTYTATATSYGNPASAEQRQLMWVLLGAAMALLLVACTNVAALELAHAVSRSRSRAVQVALGASRPSLIRIALMESAVPVAVAALLGLGVTAGVIPALTSLLPRASGFVSENPLGLHWRVVGFTVAAALLAWVCAVVPVVVSATRSGLRSLSRDGRTQSSSRATLAFRQGLTVIQISTAVVLVIGALLYVRTYQELLRLDKGFDSSGLAVVDLAMPRSALPAGSSTRTFVNGLADALRAVPGVAGATTAAPPPSTGDSPMQVTLEVDGKPMSSPPFGLARNWIDPDYFAVTRLPLRSGRFLQSNDSAAEVVISESLARRLWPNGDAIGGTFRTVKRGWFSEPSRVVGVVGDFRTAPRRMPQPDDARFHVYALKIGAPWTATAPAASPSGSAPKPVDTGGSYLTPSVTIRIETSAAIPTALAAARRYAPLAQPTITTVDAEYAERHAETLLATRVVGAFGIFALTIALVGIYGVMAFLVATRTREIGIRMALGADARAVVGLVLRSSGRMILFGTVAGLAAAAWASGFIESQLFGVTRTDSFTYALVALAVVVTALLATWTPARRAARTNPTITLRAE
jgi:putative ABC transport system permease protein